jgi:signal transduction histidine kinase
MGVRNVCRDVALAVGAAAVMLAAVTIAPASRTALDPLGCALMVAGAAALAFRRRAPGQVVLFTTACELAYLLLGYPGVDAALPVMVALYTAVRRGSRLIALVPLGALLVVMGSDLTHYHGEAAREIFQDRFLQAGWFLASMMLGGAFRQWEAYVHEADERALEAERTREEAALRRANEERLRIARELHDSLTHSISIIKVQAGIAVHLARKRGEQVPEALMAVQEASGEAMRELRATLEVLRADTADPPAHGLEGLGDLIARVRSAGLPAEVTIEGERRKLADTIERAAYRIVQESLTNVSRHAGPAATARVCVHYGVDALTVRVDDDGLATPAAPPEPGVGLSGMRERITALGGSLTAGPRAEGGFGVRAVLPLSDIPQRTRIPR